MTPILRQSLHARIFLVLFSLMAGHLCSGQSFHADSQNGKKIIQKEAKAAALVDLGNGLEAARLYQEAALEWKAEADTARYLQNSCRVALTLPEDKFTEDVIRFLEKAAMDMSCSCPGHISWQSKILRNLAERQQYLGNFGKSLSYLRHAEANNASLPDSLIEEKIYTYRQLGWVNKWKGNYELYKLYLDKCFSLAQAYSGEDEGLLPSIYQARSNYAQMTGNYDQAFDYLNKALAYYQIPSRNNPKQIGAVYLNMGVLLYELEKYEEAIDCLHKARNLFSETLGKDHLYVAYCYNNLGNNHRRLGNPMEALSYQEKSLNIRKNLFGEVHESIGDPYLNMGNTYSDIGEVEKALRMHKKALHIWNQTFGPGHVDTGLAYSAIGDDYQILGKFDLALDYFHKVGKLRKETWGIRHPLISENWQRIASVYKDLNNIEEGLNAVQKALISGHSSFSNADPHINPPLYGVLDKPAYLDVIYLKGKLLKQKALKSGAISDFDFARETFELGMDLLDTLKIRSFFGKTQLQMGAKGRKLFEGALEITYELHHRTWKPIYLEKAYEYVERSKANVLLTALQDAKAKNYGGIPQEVLSREMELQREIVFYEQEVLREEIKSPEKSSENLSLYHETLFDLKQRYQAFIKDLERDFPAYYHTKYNSPKPDLAALQTLLSKNQNQVISFFLGDSVWYVMGITQDRVIWNRIEHVQPVESRMDDLIKMLRDSQLAQNHGNDPKVFRQFTEHAYVLYQYLINPVLDPESRKIWFIPDGKLAYLPLEILITRLPESEEGAPYSKLDYLLVRHPVGYEYSATLWVEQSSHTRTPQRNLTQFAGFAPAYSGSRTGVTFSSNRNGFLFRDNLPGPRALEHNQSEVENIAAQWHGHAYTGDDPTESKFMEVANRYRILHLAMHAISHDSLPEFSGLYFSNPLDAAMPSHPLFNRTHAFNDGFLSAAEIYALSLNAELTVLSACNTGSGKLAKGEGVMSLARAFKYAGCPNIIMSLWQAEDEATSRIMDYFYQNLKSGQEKDDALRTAKIQYLEKEAKFNPFYWASFVLIGNSHPVAFTPLSPGYLPLGILAFAMVMVFFIARLYLRSKELDSP